MYVKLQYLEKVISELKNIDIHDYNFSETLSNFKNSTINIPNDSNLEEKIIEIILESKKRNESVGNYYINLFRMIKLNGNLELDKKTLISNLLTLTNKCLKDLKIVWNEENDIILQNYFLCLIFNKELYSNPEYFMMKATMLVVLLKFRILLNTKYIGRELIEEELIYTIKTHEEDLSHDDKFFSKFYKTKYKEKINISDLTKKLLTLTY